MKIKPLPYQIKSIEKMEDFGGRSLLANEMGLGKTLTSLWWWKRYAQADRGLVICPASAKYVWEHEALSNLNIHPYVIEGTKPKPLKIAGMQPKLIIVNYDVLHQWMGMLRKFDFRTLFVDECHFCKNPTTKRTKAVKLLSKDVTNMIAISGTPLTNRPIELFPILQMLWPSIFPSQLAYAHEYCKPRWTPWGWKYDGACRIPELNDLLKQVGMVRYLKKDVLKELPKKTHRMHLLTLPDKAEYQEASGSFLSWLGQRDPARLAKAEKAEALVRLGELKRLAARLKLRAMVDWTNEWLMNYPDEKLVLFTVHRKMIEALARRVEAKSVVIDGSISGRKRKAVVEQFQSDRATRVCIGNIKAAGVAISLTAASTVAFCELDWVPANMMQAADRIHRIGQSRPTWIWWLIAAKTIEEDLCQILERKQRIVTGVLDGKDADDELNVYEQLLEKYSRIGER